MYQTQEEPLDALLVAERAPKRGAGVTLQSCMDSLRLGVGVQSGEGVEGGGWKSGYMVNEDTINSSCGRCVWRGV